MVQLDNNRPHPFVSLVAAMTGYSFGERKSDTQELASTIKAGLKDLLNDRGVQDCQLFLGARSTEHMMDYVTCGKVFEAVDGAKTTRQSLVLSQNGFLVREESLRLQEGTKPYVKFREPTNSDYIAMASHGYSVGAIRNTILHEKIAVGRFLID